MTRLHTTRMLLGSLLVAALSGCGAVSPPAHRTHPGVLVTVTVRSRPTSRPLPAGFVGLSLEYTAVAAYDDPAAVWLIRRLAPGQRPVLRIGGNSSDETWWPQPGRPTPRGTQFVLTKRWVQRLAALAKTLGARLILGLNLAAERPGVAAAEARAFERGIGPNYIEAFEIGNEPDLYGLFPWQHSHVLRRPPTYGLTDFVREFSRWRTAIGRRLPVAGPAYATFDWSLGRFIDSEPRLKLVTFHHYALDACLTKPSQRGYPTIERLLSPRSSTGLAHQIAGGVAAAHARGIDFRLDELNSASCGGKPGVSNSSASAVWMLDTLFSLARAGVDGVNVHTFPGAAYAPFTGRQVRPEYYGMLMFARAFPPGARLLAVSVSPQAPLKAWATDDAGHVIRVVLINKDPHRAYRVQLDAPGLAGSVQLVRLRAGPSRGSAGSISVPPASAVLITR